MGEANFFEWTDDLEVGVDMIDDDHRILIDLINETMAAREAGAEPDVVASILNALLDYTEFHFTREEAVQDAIEYEDRVKHAKIHEGFRARIVEFRDAQAKDPADFEMGPVSGFLKDWLTNHIMVEDTALAPFVKERPEAVGAVLEMGLVDLDEIDFDNMEDDPLTRQ